MKPILIATMLCWWLAAGSMQAQDVQVVKNDTTGMTTATVSMNDSLSGGQHRNNSVSISMNGQERASAAKQKADDAKGIFGLSLDGEATENIIIVLIVLGCCVALPVLIVFFSMRYRYKMRRDECMVAARALEKGQPLPDILFQPNADKDLRAKGIRNIFLGLGLALFLGFVCGASLSTIGIFILLLGVGQVVTYYTRPKQQAAQPGAQDKDSQVESGPSPDDNPVKQD